jgi:hypothetical protein
MSLPSLQRNLLIQQQHYELVVNKPQEAMLHLVRRAYYSKEFAFIGSGAKT